MTFTCPKTRNGGQILRWENGPIPAGQIPFGPDECGAPLTRAVRALKKSGYREVTGKA